jgi:dissimilatory sulfite reductase (desulfoviridin) alpha/beta subunit
MRTVANTTAGQDALAWDAEAEELLKKLPFFIRPFARRKVEEYARSKGQGHVTRALMESARAHFMGNAAAPQAQDSESSSWQLDLCRGEEAGCPFALASLADLGVQLRQALNDCGWEEFLARNVTGPVLHHHRLRAAVAACPNACSQPQIKDIGVIATLRPSAVTQDCTGCGRCVEVCREAAVELSAKRAIVRPERCVGCGLCVRHCPAQALRSDGVRFRLLVGGKLGRHPRFATEVASELHISKVCGAVRRAVEFIKAHARLDERVGEVVERLGSEAFASSDQAV